MSCEHLRLYRRPPFYNRMSYYGADSLRQKVFRSSFNYIDEYIMVVVLSCYCVYSNCCPRESYLDGKAWLVR